MIYTERKERSFIKTVIPALIQLNKKCDESFEATRYQARRMLNNVYLPL